MDRIIQSKMHVVVKIGASGHDPIYETGLDERDNAGTAESGRSQRAGNAHANRDVGIEHAVGEKLASFFEPSGVVREESFIDNVTQLFFAGEIFRHDALARHVL